jgi:rhamnogalacturonan endolyase
MDGDNVRHYGNFLRYVDNFPADVTFYIGRSVESRDWNFAQWSWYARKPYWSIRFMMPRAVNGTATLTLGFASAQPAGEIEVRVNGKSVRKFGLKKSGAAGYRSGGQDSLYQVKYVDFPANLLRYGANEITLGHTRAVAFSAPAAQRQRSFGQVMYDAIRLEVGPAEDRQPAEGRVPAEGREPEANP